MESTQGKKIISQFFIKDGIIMEALTILTHLYLQHTVFSHVDLEMKKVILVEITNVSILRHVKLMGKHTFQDG